MEAVFGAHLPVFATLFTLMLCGSALMTGVAVAGTWRPLWQLFFYCFLLGCTDRFLFWSLFQAALFSIPGLVVDTAVLTGIALVAYRITRVWKMVTQYPWLYERTGLWSYREKAASVESNPRPRE